jgi:hypothetical protein
MTQHPDDANYWYHESPASNREGIERRGLRRSISEVYVEHNDFPEGSCPACALGDKPSESGEHGFDASTVFLHHGSYNVGSYLGDSNADIWAVPKRAVEVDERTSIHGVMTGDIDPSKLSRVGHFTEGFHTAKHDPWMPLEDCEECKNQEKLHEEHLMKKWGHTL